VQDEGMDIKKFYHRWYNHQSFDQLYPDMATIFPREESHWGCHSLAAGAQNINDLQNGLDIYLEITRADDASDIDNENTNEECLQPEDDYYNRGPADFDNGMVEMEMEMEIKKIWPLSSHP
jgi:hypothetical protein